MKSAPLHVTIVPLEGNRQSVAGKTIRQLLAALPAEDDVRQRCLEVMPEVLGYSSSSSLLSPGVNCSPTEDCAAASSEEERQFAQRTALSWLAARLLLLRACHTAGSHPLDMVLPRTRWGRPRTEPQALAGVAHTPRLAVCCCVVDDTYKSLLNAYISRRNDSINGEATTTTTTDTENSHGSLALLTAGNEGVGVGVGIGVDVVDVLCGAESRERLEDYKGALLYSEWAYLCDGDDRKPSLVLPAGVVGCNEKNALPRAARQRYRAALLLSLKESLLKALGVGLAAPDWEMRDIEISLVDSFDGFPSFDDAEEAERVLRRVPLACLRLKGYDATEEWALYTGTTRPTGGGRGGTQVGTGEHHTRDYSVVSAAAFVGAQLSQYYSGNTSSNSDADGPAWGETVPCQYVSIDSLLSFHY